MVYGIEIDIFAKKQDELKEEITYRDLRLSNEF